MRGLPAGWYLDPARGPLEFSAVFGRSWQFVCHAADLPAAGTAARFDCGGRSAFVLRTRALGLHAFRNACSHRGSRLVDGDPGTGLAFCVDGRVRCPYHGWTYDEQGRLESIPADQRFEESEPGAVALTSLPVAQWRGLVFVAFGAPERALEAALDEAATDWPDVPTMRRLAEPRTLAVEADWKLACEHALDTAHLGVTRPTPKSRLFEPGRFTVAGAEAMRAAGVPVDAARASWSARMFLRLSSPDAAPPRATWLYLWPNLLLGTTADTLTVLQALPVRTGTSRLRVLRYGRQDSSRTARLLRYLHERVVRRALLDDARLLERVQQGLANVDAATTMPIDAAQPGLRWFVERCRVVLERASPAPPRARTRTRRPRQPPVTTAG
ncbi:MAG TPA: aromatic ring-hydroxylating dioxygenase subunit alpha [Steroidobacteraceae bacterium]|nr:aromatic ring-hydroxylating dioxygenase subunit alpha [Steroidobacteraceae bacterium]